MLRLQVTYGSGGEWTDYLAPFPTLESACDMARALFTSGPSAWPDGIRVRDVDTLAVVFGFGVFPTYSVKVRQPGRPVWKIAFGGRNLSHDAARAVVANLIGAGLYSREATMTERDTYPVEYARTVRVVPLQSRAAVAR